MMSNLEQQLLEALEALANAAEDAISSDPEMDSHSVTMDAFDRELERARHLIGRAK